MTLEEKYESLNEGINDPGIFKAVFLIGGAGSGTSTVVDQLSLEAVGLKMVQVDHVEH